MPSKAHYAAKAARERRADEVDIQSRFLWPILLVVALPALVGCGTGDELPPASAAGDTANAAPLYRIGPGDNISIFVWRNEDLSVDVPVRPDGRISVPLLEDLVASGKTPTELAREIEVSLGRYVQNPLVTVIVTQFVGAYSEQVRVVGEAVSPSAIPYRASMTLLDAIIEVGGLTEFAAGNRAKLVRKIDGVQQQFSIRIDDLIRDGEIDANVELLPGDVIIIPQSYL